MINRCAFQASIDHDAHARHRQTRLRDGSGQDHATPGLIAGWPKNRLLLGQRELSMQRMDFDMAGDTAFQFPLEPADFSLSRQKHQHIACVGVQCFPHNRSLMSLGGFAQRRRAVDSRDGPYPAWAFNHGCLRAEHLQQGTDIQRGRHDEQLQVFPKPLLHIQRQRQAKIRFQAAFVKFVKDDACDSFQAGIILQHARQYALRDNFQSGGGTDLGFAPHAIAHRLPKRLAQQFSHIARGKTSGYPARLQQQPARVSGGVCPQQVQGHAGGFAGTRLGHKQTPGMGSQSRLQSGQGCFDRQGGNGGGRSCHTVRSRVRLTPWH